MKKTRIVYCIPSIDFHGGMERVLILKANYLSRKGYDIHIVVTDGKTYNSFFPIDADIKIEKLDINYDELRQQPLYKKIFLYIKKQRLFKKELNKYLCRVKPDITISLLRRDINIINKMKDGSLKLGEIHFNKSHYRNLNHLHTPAFIKRNIEKVWMKQLIRKLKKLDKFIVLSHEDQENWTELNNTTVIHNPLPYFPEKYSTNDNKQVIAVGRYVPQKGFDYLIKAWATVTSKHPDWTLHIYGSGMQEQLQQQIDSLGIRNTCKLKASTPHIYEKYYNSSIFVLSSRYEGFPMVIIEAMSCGLAPVSFTCPCGPYDIIQDKDNGFLVKSGNVEELAQKICMLIEDDNMRKQMGRKARSSVERLKIEHIGKQWEDLFHSLLSKKTNYELVQ